MEISMSLMVSGLLDMGSASPVGGAARATEEPVRCSGWRLAPVISRGTIALAGARLARGSSGSGRGHRRHPPQPRGGRAAEQRRLHRALCASLVQELPFGLIRLSGPRIRLPACILRREE